MSCSSVRRARARLRRLALAVILLVLWLAPGTPPVAARSDSDSSDRGSADGCGDNWSSASLIATLPGNLLEVSGFVSSSRHPGVAWMIRDSQNPDSLYSFELDINDKPHWKEFPVTGAASNRDWEDVTYTVGADGRGRLWILENDFAGSDTHASSMKIYEVLEPDPDTDRSARLAGTYRIEYPGGNLDTESLFALGGRLLVVAKTNPNRVFRLPWPLDPSGVNRLTEVGGLDASSLLTAVGTSGDERFLATVGIADDVSVFENRLGTGEFTAFDDQGPVFRQSMPDTQRESIDFFPFNGCDIITISEDGTVWRLSNPRSIYPQGAPGPPTGVAAVAGDDSIRVSWSPPSDIGGSGITGYRVAVHQESVEITSAITPDGSTTAATVSNLAQGVAYTFTVSALSASGEGPPSPPTAPVTLGGPPPSPPPADVPEPPPGGYWMVGSDGVVYAFGDARHRGEPAAQLGTARAVDLEPTPSGAGYWVVDDQGRVFAFGDAGDFGQSDHTSLVAGETVTSLSATPAGDGYWIFTSRGRVIPFGAARHLGDLTQVKLNGPVLDSVATPTGLGYYMVAADGGIFAFGDARFFGSMGSTKLNAPVQSLVPDSDAAGYWLVASDGGIFAFDAPFRGSLGATRLNKPITGMVRFGDGYLMVGEDGGLFNFSDRPFSGSLGDRPPPRPIVSVAALG
ncbi:MAG: fibronectin type III domain-containing protein [Actinomycetota bacterium]|nr:fibronectin type III domain-containing protein [Actinomycetota bacterium]